ncbi:MAG: vitamin K epoxide reductase family protein [Gaiellaceae bacterium]
MIERSLRFTVAVLALIGAGIAGYLTYTHFNGTAPVCLNGGGCEVVQNSRWSKVFHIPVALLGLLAYLSIVATTLIRHPLAKEAGATMAVTALGFNAYLLYVQAYDIGRYCTWCVSNEIVSALLAPVALAWLLWRPKDVPA